MYFSIWHVAANKLQWNYLPAAVQKVSIIAHEDFREWRNSAEMNSRMHRFILVEVIKAECNLQRRLCRMRFFRVCWRVTNVFNLQRWQSQFCWIHGVTLIVSCSECNSKAQMNALSINLQHTIKVSRGSPDIDVIFYQACNDVEVNGCVWLTGEMTLLGGWFAQTLWVACRLRQTAQPARDAGCLVTRVFGKRVGKMWPYIPLTHTEMCCRWASLLCVGVAVCVCASKTGSIGERWPLCSETQGLGVRISGFWTDHVVGRSSLIQEIIRTWSSKTQLKELLWSLWKSGIWFKYFLGLDKYGKKRWNNVLFPDLPLPILLF